MLLASAILLRASLRSPRIYRRQVGAIIVAIGAPAIGNVVYLAGLSPIPHLDLTPYAFTVTGLALAWAMVDGRLLDLVLGFPLVAGAVIVERMHDGVILVDGRETIVEINPVASRIIGEPTSPTGRPIRDVLPEWDSWTSSKLTIQPMPAELTRGQGPARRDYDVTVAGQLPTSSRGIGWIVVIRDVTERKRTEAQLRAANEAEIARRIEEARLEAGIWR